MIISLADVFSEVIERAALVVDRLKYVQPERILVLTQKMSLRQYGHTAGLRHARQGRVYTPVFPEVTHHGRDIRYLITFNPYLLHETYRKKECALEVVMHELWHVADACDGRLRSARHGKSFDRTVKAMVKEYLDAGGVDLPVLSGVQKVRVQEWRGREKPSILFVPKGIIGTVMSSRVEQKRWDEKHVKIRTVEFQHACKQVYVYSCPNGHQTETAIIFKKPRSCARCSVHFDQRFLLSR